MNGGVKNRFLCALIASAGLSFGIDTAKSADLGGDCCADLEERVAELEATTARKGNRKVSLTISGWVTQQVMGWDDGIESDAYVGTSLNDLGDRLHFDGSAKIDAEWSAGYSVRLDITGANGFVQDANNANGGSGPPGSLNSYWWLKSERLGRVFGRSPKPGIRRHLGRSFRRRQHLRRQPRDLRRSEFPAHPGWHRHAGEGSLG